MRCFFKEATNCHLLLLNEGLKVDRGISTLTCLSWVSVAVIHTMTKSTLGRKGLISAYSLQSIMRGSQVELKARSDTEAMEATLLTGLLPWLFTFL